MAAKKASTRPLAVRVAIALAAGGVLWYAVEGGEWGTLDLLRQQRRLGRLKHDVDSLSHAVDSLTSYRKALASDPVLQEKIAREEYGMVRGSKELLYRFTEPAPGDTVRKKAK